MFSFLSSFDHPQIFFCVFLDSQSSVLIEHNIYYVLPLLFITNITNLLHLLATVLIISEFSFSVNLCTYFSTFLKYFNDFPNRFLCILYISNCPTISRIPILFSTFRHFLQIIPTSLCHNNVIYISFFCVFFILYFPFISRIPILFSACSQFLQIISSSFSHTIVMYFSFFVLISYTCFIVISKTAWAASASRIAFLFTRERSFLVTKK